VSLAADAERGVASTPAVVGEADAATAPAEYIGLVTRAIAFAVDAAVIQLVAIAVGGTIALILTVVSLPDELDTVLVVVGSVAYVLWLVGYFVVFWSTTGQTPGNRLLQIRVSRVVDGAAPRTGAAVLRFAGVILATLPLFAGFLPILFDDRRRGLHDMLAGTVVVSALHDQSINAPAP
jgi:uncharacterized RDD family membrane protein YckC